MKIMAPVSLMAIALLAFAITGCSDTAAPPAAPPAGSGTPSAGGDHADHDDGDHAGHGDHDGSASGQTDMEKMKIELAKLSPEDAASAEKQHVCPVSGKMLGAMGAPLKIDVNGQSVWICCDSCKDTLLEDPDKYLAKLKTE